MGHYRANVADLEFALFDLLGLGDDLEAFGTDRESVRAVLTELAGLAQGVLADSFTDGDRNPPVYDPAAFDVRMPESVRKAMSALVDGEWDRVHLSEDLGGPGLPPSVAWACSELILASNPVLFFYMGGKLAAGVVQRNGTPEQRSWARTMVDRNWAGTMVLTEPDAGSDVGAGRTKAVLQDDGTWHLSGVKRFITGGAQGELAENTVHLVLARPEGPGVETKPGTKGLGLFVVPMWHFSEDGSLGERNGVYATNLEHKMGIKASTTCELTFGAHGVPAVGWLLGDRVDGIAQMFQLIEHARMMVGCKAIGTLSAAYLTALDFAKTRVQGSDMTQLLNRAAPKVTVIHHPEVRRSLLEQKAYAEGMRAMYLYAARWQDRAALGDPDAPGMADLLLPIVKGVGSERGWRLLPDALQILGGSGYLQDYSIEQYIRDGKIDSLYEGTTAIQSLDFFFRKVVRDNRASLERLLSEVEAFDDARLTRAVTDFRTLVDTLVGYLGGVGDDAREVYKVGQNTVRLLMAAGDLVIGWLLLRSAAVAGTPGKTAAAEWFATTVLPRISLDAATAATTDNRLMDLAEGDF